MPPIGEIQIRTIFTEDVLQPILGLEFLKNYEASLLYSSKYQQHFLTLPSRTENFKLLSEIVLPANQTIFATILCETRGAVHTNSLYIIEENGNSMTALTTIKQIESDHDDRCTRVELSLPFVNSSNEQIILKELVLTGELFHNDDICESHEIFSIVPPYKNTSHISAISVQNINTEYVSLPSGSDPFKDKAYHLTTLSEKSIVPPK